MRSVPIRPSLAIFLVALLLAGAAWSWRARERGMAREEAAPALPVGEPAPAAPDPVPAAVATSPDAPPPDEAAVRRAIEALPFSHDYLALDSIEERELRPSGDGRWVRRTLGRLDSYPDLVVIAEFFALDAAGRPVLEASNVEVAAEWILHLRSADPGALEALRADYAAEVVRGIAEVNLWTLRFAPRTLAQRDGLRARLGDDPRLAEVFPNDIIWPIARPDDPSYPNQWELLQIDPEPGWDLATDAAINDRVNVVAAIIDTGVNVNSTDIHAWLNPDEIAGNGIDDDGNGRIDDLHGYDFYANSGDVQRSSGHGVTVGNYAGSISNNTLGRASPSWSVELLAGICFSADGKSGSVSAASSAIAYAVSEGARVINCSFIGGGSYSYTYAFSLAANHNAIVVAGAGNNGKNLDTALMYPVCAPQDNVIGVGATDTADNRASFSNYSATHIEVFAPHTGGTSFATPTVTSLVALLVGDDPEAPYGEIIDRVLAGVDHFPSLEGLAVSGGRVNLTRSLRLNTVRRPSGLQAALVAGGVRLTWTDRATEESGFLVERSTTDPATVRDPDDPAAMTWTVLASDIPANQTWYEDTSPGAGSSCFYRVRAIGPTRPSARNPETRVVATTSAVDPVEALEGQGEGLASLGAPDAIDLAWFDHAANETGFVLERSEDGGTHFFELAWLGAGATGYRDTEIVPGATYHYRLKTRNAFAGVYSSTVVETAAAEADPVVIVAPGGLQLAATATTADLGWSDQSTGERAYRIYRATDAAGPFALLAELAADAKSYTDDTVAPETTYFYEVEVVSPFGNALCPAQAVSTPALPAVLVAPSLAGQASDPTTVALTWSDDDSLRQTGYLVERAPGAAGAFSTVATLDPSARSWTDSGLTPESSYRFRVSVTDGTDLAPSDIVSVTTPAYPALLVAPILGGGAVDATTVALSWVDESSQRQTGYLVERAPGAAGAFSTVGTLGPAERSWTDSTATPETTYRYRVSVVDGTDAVSSNELAVTTPALPPVLVAPDLAAAALGPDAIQLAWTDLSQRASGYRVEQADSAGGPFALVASLPPDATGWLAAGLAEGRSYFFRVTVFADATGEAVASPVVGARTLSVEEAWRLEHFGTTAATGPAAPDADPDSDGWINLAEYATLHSPTEAQGSLTEPGRTADGRVTLTFRRRSGVPVTFRVEASDGLTVPWTVAAELPAGGSSWNVLLPGVEVTETPTEGGTTVTVIDEPGGPSAPRYLRLVLESLE